MVMEGVSSLIKTRNYDNQGALPIENNWEKSEEPQSTQMESGTREKEEEQRESDILRKSRISFVKISSRSSSHMRKNASSSRRNPKEPKQKNKTEKEGFCYLDEVDRMRKMSLKNQRVHLTDIEWQPSSRTQAKETQENGEIIKIIRNEQGNLPRKSTSLEQKWNKNSLENDLRDVLSHGRSYSKPNNENQMKLEVSRPNMRKLSKFGQKAAEMKGESRETQEEQERNNPIRRRLSKEAQELLQRKPEENQNDLDVSAKLKTFLQMKVNTGSRRPSTPLNLDMIRTNQNVDFSDNAKGTQGLNSRRSSKTSENSLNQEEPRDSLVFFTGLNEGTGRKEKLNETIQKFRRNNKSKRSMPPINLDSSNRLKTTSRFLQNSRKNILPKKLKKYIDKQKKKTKTTLVNAIGFMRFAGAFRKKFEVSISETMIREMIVVSLDNLLQNETFKDFLLE